MLTFVTLIAFLVVLAGPAIAHFHLVSPLVGVGTSILGLGLMVVSFLFGVGTLFRRWKNWLAVVLGFVAVAALGALGFIGSQNPLHDLSTDLTTPPKFQHPFYSFEVKAGSEYLDESLRMSREFDPGQAATQQLLYPAITPFQVEVPTKEAFPAILKAIQSRPTWKIVLNGAEQLRLEAEVEEPVFGIITDVVIEVRSVPDHDFDSVIALRSRLRMIVTDLGWDAYVLRELRAQLDSALKPLEHKFAKQRAEFELGKNKTQPTQPANPPKEEPKK